MLQVTLLSFHFVIFRKLCLKHLLLIEYLAVQCQEQQKENFPPIFESFSNLSLTPQELQGSNAGNSSTLASHIDLTSALIPQNVIKPSTQGLKTKPEPDKHFKSCDTEVVLLCNANLQKKSDICKKAAPSKFGNVICRQWAHAHSSLKKEPVQNKISRFMFDTPSPDDAIRDAQKSSGISTRHFMR
jgi:hypothetical protein